MRTLVPHPPSPAEPSAYDASLGDASLGDPSPAASLAKVLRRWDIVEPYELLPVPGAAHRCWHVRTGPGSVLLLKRYAELDPAGRRRLLREHAVTTALDAAGLPVPAPIPARTGRTLVQSDGRGHALYPWTDGLRRDGLELSLDQCRELGELLGRLHAAMSRLTPVQQSLLVPTSRAADAIAAADRMLAELPEGGDGPAARAGQRLRERRSLLAEFAGHQPPEVEAFAVGPVHGAFGARNLLYGRTRRVAAVVGWGGLRDGPFALDVVRAAVSLFAHRTGEPEGLDLGRVEAFVRGHAAEFPVDPGQISSAVHRRWWELLCDVGPPHGHDLGRDVPSPRGSEGPAPWALAAWWTEHLDRTLDVFAAACRPEPAEPPPGRTGLLDGP